MTGSKRTPLIFTLVAVLVSTECMLAVVQDGSIRLSARELDGYERDEGYWGIQLGGLWQYHPGDRKEWAHPEFDDGAWPLIDPTTFEPADADQPQPIWSGIGWYRLRLSCSPKLMGEILALTVVQMGATEVYHNGKLVYAYGKVSPSPEIESAVSFSDNTRVNAALLDLGDDTEHVIALRHSFSSASLYKRAVPKGLYHRPVLIPVVERHEVAYRRAREKASMASASNGVLCGLFFTVALLHFMLFLFFPESQKNLFYSVFVAAFAFYTALDPRLRSTDLMGRELTIYVLMLFVWCILIFLLRFFYDLLYSRTPRVFWILSSIITLCIALDWMFLVNVVVCLELIRIYIVGARRRIDGFPILVTGGITAVLIVLSWVFETTILGTVRIEDLIVSYLALSPQELAIVAFVLSMSIYLARDVGRTNKELKALNVELEDRVRQRTAELQAEQERSEELLLNILPQPVAERLKRTGETIADNFSDVTVLFADIVKFTEMSAKMMSAELVDLLNRVFTAFDHLAEKHRLEKIKTIGDAYMVVGGLPDVREDHAEAIAEMSMDMHVEISRLAEQIGKPLQVRIGIHTGPVTAGIIGKKKFIYDLWGDTVNTASRMESYGLAGETQVTDETCQRLKYRYAFRERGVIDVKGKGKIKAFLLAGRLSEIPASPASRP